MKRLTIDRFEDDVAVCETQEQTMVSISRKLIPEHAIEGSLLEQNNDGSYRLINNEQTRNRIKKKMDDLFE